MVRFPQWFRSSSSGSILENILENIGFILIFLSQRGLFGILRRVIRISGRP